MGNRHLLLFQRQHGPWFPLKKGGIPIVFAKDTGRDEQNSNSVLHKAAYNGQAEQSRPLKRIGIRLKKAFKKDRNPLKKGLQKG